MSQAENPEPTHFARARARWGYPGVRPLGLAAALLFASAFVWFRSVESIFLGRDARYVGMSVGNRREIRRLRFEIWGKSASFHPAAIALPLAFVPLGAYGWLVSSAVPLLPLPVRPEVAGGLAVTADLLCLLQVAQWLVWIAAGPELFEVAAQVKQRPSEMLVTLHPSIRGYLLGCVAVAIVGFLVASLVAGEPVPMWLSSPWMGPYLYG